MWSFSTDFACSGSSNRSWTVRAPFSLLAQIADHSRTRNFLGHRTSGRIASMRPLRDDDATRRSRSRRIHTLRTCRILHCSPDTYIRRIRSQPPCPLSPKPNAPGKSLWPWEELRLSRSSSHSRRNHRRRKCKCPPCSRGTGSRRNCNPPSTSQPACFARRIRRRTSNRGPPSTTWPEQNIAS